MPAYAKDLSRFRLVVFPKPAGSPSQVFYSFIADDKASPAKSLNGMIRRFLYNPSRFKGKYITALLYDNNSNALVKKYVSGIEERIEIAPETTSANYKEPKYKLVVYLKEEGARPQVYYSKPNEENEAWDEDYGNRLLQRSIFMPSRLKGKYKTALLYDNESNMLLRKFINDMEEPIDTNQDIN